MHWAKGKRNEIVSDTNGRNSRMMGKGKKNRGGNQQKQQQPIIQGLYAQSQA